ncbi:serine protease [Roseivirga sp. E12]|uniref:S1 family peptidase n=1 Tax=Roseivirga sp. E12 TaxID=2819237 RepID=UPI001ABD2561|nr:serine protease [Roseivirga sp. E12]MBO3697400.1 trypsin-like peptidase domain-containing protein [Roseivirga sp. E12]
MINKRTILIVTSVLFIQLASINGQIDRKFISNSVMKVIVDYGNGEETATGFLWKDKTTLVTSYHVVKAGYKSITIQDVFGWKARAEISKVYKPADLMLLEITSTPGDDWVPFTQIDPSVAEGEKTKAYGYNGSAAGIVPITLEKTDPIPGGTLYYAIPKEDREAIKALGFPSLKLPIMYLLGGLLPGYSGSPILNNQGELVAIGDGGLNKGTTNSSWGIPVENLSKLSSANLDLASSGSGRLFSSGQSSSEKKKSEEAEFRLEGGEDFFYTKTVKLIDILENSDDPQMLRGILGAYEDFGFDLEGIEFEVYQEVTSNYVIVIPRGSKIETKGNYFEITAFDQNLWATFTPRGLVKNSLNEFAEWTMTTSNEKVDNQPFSKEEFQTTSDGIMRMVQFLEYNSETNTLDKLWAKKGLKVHDNTAFIQARTWLKDVDAEEFIACYTSESGSECNTKVKERVKVAVIMNIMMNLMTIANTQVLYIEPLREVYWEEQDNLHVSFPESLTITEVSNSKLKASTPEFNMSLSAEELEEANNFNSLSSFMDAWAGALPQWKVIEESVSDDIQKVNGFNAVFGFYETDQEGLNALLFTAYKPEAPRTRYNWIVIFEDDKFDTVNEMIKKFGRK